MVSRHGFYWGILQTHISFSSLRGTKIIAMKLFLRLINLTIAGILIANLNSKAQSANGLASPDSLFYGTWKGSSICQIKSSPCRDETVVYYISKSGRQNIIEVRANKIVNGAEEEMGIIEFRYDPSTKEIISVSQPSSIWKFKRNNNTLSGTLMDNGKLYRIIQLARQK